MSMTDLSIAAGSPPIPTPTPTPAPAPETNVGSVASGVRMRVLAPLAGVMLLLFAISVGVFLIDANHRQTEDLARTATSVDTMFREQSAAGVQVVQSIMELVLQDPKLEAAFRARDRQTLLELSAPILASIRDKDHITHFYYILPDRTMLLRVQAPDKYGDKIDRFVLQEAQRTGKPFWGNEQGPLGSFTLRVAYPWISNGELIGYLEMGIEFEDIMRSIKNYLDVDVFVAIDKPFFDQAKWEEAQRKTERPVPWNEFPSVVVLSRTMPEIPAPIREYLGGLKEQQHDKDAFEIEWDDQVAQVIVVPFANLRKQQLGELIVVRDITASASERRLALYWMGFLGAVVGTCLLLFFYGLLGRVQRDVADRTVRLGEAQRVLTVEQFERQRVQQDLGRQQERNELLEARSQMVEALAVAKDAAEAALRDNKEITQKLHEAQSELVTTARQAGMAEIANNVLHNVGNVLNSVNVSAGLITSRMRDSKAQGLAKAVQLINEHKADLGDFLTRDEKGKLLPGYLNKLVAALAEEHRGIAEEFAALTKSVEHIKDIVATQQSYAGAASLAEEVQARDLLEDALRMNAGALAQHQVTVVKEFADVPLLLLDKPRVLQILVNLIGNAQQAMDGVTDRARQITLRLDIADLAVGRRLRIGVADNGQGIAPENMTRIFSHGFTTKKSGHGFGLHSAVLAAKEMGGSLTAHSEGSGKGATFTLELPVKTVGGPA
jgi:signal transduction histidine kinase